MQEDFPNKILSYQDDVYNSSMGRRLTKHRPKQGARLAELRKAAGLSQYELARRVGVPQANIAFWERSEKPPRSEVLPKMAEALSVKVEELLDTSPVKKVIERKGGPVGKVRKVFEQVSKLPRHQQDKIVEVVTLFVRQYEQRSQGLEK